MQIAVGTFFVFSDEAGAYQKNPSESFRQSHPFYIRSNVRMSAEDYRLFQNELKALNERYGVPVGEEIKWSDLWEVIKGRPRADFLREIQPDRLKGYYRKVFEAATQRESVCFFFSITFLFIQHGYQAEMEILKFHLQEVMQRMEMDAKPDGFVTIILDEVNHDKDKLLKAVCHRLSVEGDFVKYNHLYHGVLMESSAQSAGIQLADFSAGITNGFLRGALLDRGRYEFATNLFQQYIKPNLRRVWDMA